MHASRAARVESRAEWQPIADFDKLRRFIAGQRVVQGVSDERTRRRRRWHHRLTDQQRMRAVDGQGGSRSAAEVGRVG